MIGRVYVEKCLFLALDLSKSIFDIQTLNLNPEVLDPIDAFNVR
jgi:hypothetical protein